MAESTIINYVITDPVELNLSYMPFITNGGLFVPTEDFFSLGDKIQIDLQLPMKRENLIIEGKVVWITSKNALHHVLAGIGVQFTGNNSPVIRGQIETLLDKSIEVGGYTYGITDNDQKNK